MHQQAIASSQGSEQMYWPCIVIKNYTETVWLDTIALFTLITQKVFQ